MPSDPANLPEHAVSPVAHRATRWQIRDRVIDFPRRPLLMGIINVTPDSFSDGGRFFNAGAAIAQALQLVSEGADFLDIGGESTRPYAEVISADEELRRVLHVIESVARQTSVPISIDTTKATVAQAAINAGATIINDISGLAHDPQMLDVARQTNAGICAMHMRGTPQTMQDNPTYVNVVNEVQAYLAELRDALLAAGIPHERICLDPGIGFGKTHEHNITLMGHCSELHALGCPLLVGFSRKGFLGKLIGNKEADRTDANIGAALAIAVAGVQILRVHDVRPIREALAVFEACAGLK